MFNIHFRRETETLPVEPARTDFPALYGADLAGMIQGRRRGGDFYHFLRVSPNRVLFGLLDVAGRHAENHAIVARARQSFQDTGCEKFCSEDINEADAMMEFSMQLNLSAIGVAGHGTAFWTADRGNVRGSHGRTASGWVLAPGITRSCRSHLQAR